MSKTAQLFALTVLISFAGSCAREAPFDREVSYVSNTLTATLGAGSAPEIRRDGNTMSAKWSYSSFDSSQVVRERIAHQFPSDYKVIDPSANTLVLSKAQSGDSYQLSIEVLRPA
jgi:hypothetical protein